MNEIIGAKGGGSHKPVEATDNVRSKQIARFVDVLGEGEIVGLVDGLKSVFFNETPLQNDDGSYNFSDVSMYARYGTVYQDPVPDMTDTEFEVAVGTEVKFATPITRTLNQANVGAVRVTIGFPQMTEQNLDNGDLNGSSVTVRIQIQQGSAGFVDAVIDKVTCKTTSKYQRAYTIALSGSGPWDIRVSRVTPDSTSSAIQNKFTFDSYTGIIPVKLAYPNTALMAVRIDAANFSSIPNRAYHIKGLIIKVPTNYDPVARTYSGMWDGTFKLAWSNNPAWCFYDLLTNPRYGLGKWVTPDQIDKWNLYSIAQYCDTLVPNGRGGQEPRFTCNLYLQAREEAYTVIQNMASIFRAITYWSAGSIYTVQDRPADPVAQFVPGNVVDGNFGYSGSSLKSRHTAALVSWNDPDDFYRQKIEYVQDDELVAQYGVIELQVTGFGCSSQSQAHRLGKWMLATERYTNETIAFRAGLDGLNLYPGAIIRTTDPNRAGTRMGGRLLSFTAGTPQTLRLDQVFTQTPGHTYQLTVTRPDGTLETQGVAVFGLSSDGQYTEIRPASNFSTALDAGAVWVLTDLNTVVPELWRVTALIEAEGNMIDVNAINYVPSLYDGVETGIQITPLPINDTKTRPDAPTALGVTVSQYRVDGQIAGLRALLSWTSSAGHFRLSYRKAGEQWRDLDVYTSSYEFDNVDAATYDFMVVAINGIGRESTAALLSANLSAQAVSNSPILPAPANLRLIAPYERAEAIFGWDAVPGGLFYEVQLSQQASPFSAYRTDTIGNVFRYTYGAADMKGDGGPYRNITMRVRAHGLYGALGEWATITVGNPQVGQLQGVSVSAGIGTIFFKCDTPSDPDFEGILIWLGTSPSFTPGDGNLAYVGATAYASFNALPTGEPLQQDATYYIRAAGFDAIGRDNLNISPSLAVNVYGKAPDEASIIASMIKDGALTATKFANGIEPVGVFASLPDVQGYTGPKTINVGGVLYVLINGAWESPTASVGPGSISLDELDPSLTNVIGRVTGDVNTPGSIANDVAAQIAQQADLTADDVRYYGTLAQTAMAAAQFAIKTTSTAMDAVSTRSTALIARVGDDISAAITTYDQVVASVNYASALSVQSLATTVNGHTTSISQQTSSINGLSARVEWKIDNNGVISGIALDSTTDRYGASTSAAVFRVDVFQIAGTGVAASPIFEVITRNGQKMITLAGTKISDGTITAAQIAANTITAAQIAAGTITTTELKAGAITTDIIVVGTNGGIPGTLIKNGAISTAKIATGAITADHMTANSIAAGVIQANAVTAREIAADSITASKIKAGEVTSDKINARGLSILDSNGVVILSAYAPLAKQAASNPNLCPTPQGFKTFYGNAYSARNGDGHFNDGQYLWLPAAGSNYYCAAESPALGIPWGAYYTVSFEAYVTSGSRALTVDVYNGIDWDGQGLTVTLTNTLTRYTFVEAAVGSSNAPQGRLRIYTNVAGSGDIVVANIKVELGTTATPWCDSVITQANASTFIQSAAIQSAMINDLRTANYSEDGSGNATAGAKLASYGTALKVANDSFQVGSVVFSDYWFRLVQAIDGNRANGRVIWRGNNDATMRGGAPNIACLALTPTSSQVLNSNYQQVTYDARLTPTSYSSYSDNLDAMQQIHLQFFTSTQSYFTEVYQNCPSRTYDGASGVVRTTVAHGWRFGGAGSTPGVTQQYETAGVFTGYIRARIGNTYGWSATQDFAPGQSVGTPLNLTTMSAGGASSGGGSGGSSSGGGGACPAPWVKVRLISGVEVHAADLHNGAIVAAVDDTTLQPIAKGGVIRDIATIWSQRYRVTLSDGRATEWSENHRFAVEDNGWVQVQDLRAGDRILGLEESVVASVLAVGKGQVVSFRVEGAGTYFAGGLLCHNYKMLP